MPTLPRRRNRAALRSPSSAAGGVINTRRADTGHDACRVALVMLASIGPLEHGDTLRVTVVYG